MPKKPAIKKTTILAVASKGGHWEQLCQITPAFLDTHVTMFVTTDPGIVQDRDLKNCCTIKDYSQSEPAKVIMGLIESYQLVRKTKPAVVISTGAAPGLLCLLWGRVFGAKTIWVDSIANAEKLSLSGRLASLFATLTFTQWESLADGTRIQYAGSLL
ncbi:hypothetical protein [Celeribacter halophilus]|uniref:Oligosaccharide biosynthesis protein Alg14 like n=1 Tax=Celeribacter halophilus TaxID=576117 RepID=A0A1I3WGX8_9RHOB|nr:hypothetical protein [Celeribacter halophilus]PZX09851.1 oligosaccharide biosynthesis protein Alg14 [Celeribacter halophilus]SFK06765.1 Oligosaccharide biosynthesis protein Alg14 like [Celeribacter halophilus]